MTDVFTPEKRSEVMGKIRSRDTKPEEMVRKWLFFNGFRYRKNVSNLPGKPDIVLPRYRTVVFVNGCFWHAHEGCRLFVVPKTRREWWLEKLGGNRARDERNMRLLREAGWNVVIVWECALKNKKQADITLGKLEELIKNNERTCTACNR
ncbi:DNA mismatch endonuclease (patch repair protein) [Sporomusaceae bacterium BoRhaA]|uniref:very short patch repair endonuclease n=1 Tax=Pelorhabdus rhamnosifermentans TaxID=2772457 RepID=UPI001C064653|nr:DNA mismatch endonuclease Vsr [Pelorhabdus rhamnosifermentans]MBU2704074.1 DNA mismatch endonuclease (patch repair protein) [Pelorhabdus rhamnosifermentans]